jgi:hypothetical protein
MSKSLNAMQWSMAMVLVLALSLLAVFSLPLGGGPEGMAKMTLADILEVCRCRDRLDGELALMQQSCDLHRDILTRLVEGRLSLAEAAATLCEQIEGLPPHLRPKPFFSFPGAHDEETRMRMTIEWAEIFLRNHPYRDEDEIRSRLHRELQAFCEAKIRCTPPPSEERSCGPCGVPMNVARRAQE